MSIQDDIDSLKTTIDRASARKAELETLTRASQLMREAADLVLKVDSPEATEVARHLSAAFDVLTKRRGEGDDA